MLPHVTPTMIGLNLDLNELLKLATLTSNETVALWLVGQGAKVSQHLTLNKGSNRLLLQKSNHWMVKEVLQTMSDDDFNLAM